MFNSYIQNRQPIVEILFEIPRILDVESIVKRD